MSDILGRGQHKISRFPRYRYILILVVVDFVAPIHLELVARVSICQGKPVWVWLTYEGSIPCHIRHENMSCAFTHGTPIIYVVYQPKMRQRKTTVNI